MNELANNNETITTQMKQVIREMYFPNSSEAEFQAFLFDANAKGLDPLQKEIIPIQFRGKTTTVVSRDGYVKKAKENPSFLGYRSQPIYENDEFTYEEDNEGFHYSFKTRGFGDRGKLVGAFCHVTMKDPVEDTFALVSFTEVRQNTPVWKSNPTFMTQKVAEVRALKPVCNLAGVCSDVELGQNITNDEEVIDVETEAQTRPIPQNSTTNITPKKKEQPHKEEEEQREKQTQLGQYTINTPKLTTNKEITKYFESFKRKEGFNKEEINKELRKLYENNRITQQFYNELIHYASNINENEQLYKYEAEQ